MNYWAKITMLRFKEMVELLQMTHRKSRVWLISIYKALCKKIAVEITVPHESIARLFQIGRPYW